MYKMCIEEKSYLHIVYYKNYNNAALNKLKFN